MIAELKHLKNICCDDITKIDNYYEAINDDKHMWDLHHKLGLNHSLQELKDNNLYYHRPAKELEFLCAASKEEEFYYDLKSHHGKHANTKKRIEASFEFNSFVDKLSRESCKDSLIVNNKLAFESWIESLLRYEMMSKRYDIDMLSVHTGLKRKFIEELLNE